MKSLRLSFVIRHSSFVIAAVAFIACLAAPLASAADLSITAGNVAVSDKAIMTVGTAGATITAGQLVYYDTTANTYKLADANGATPLYKVAGIATNGASSGQRLYVCKEDPALTLGATLVIGDTLWASANPGGITKTASEGVASGNFVSSLGVAISTTKLNFKIARADAVTP